MSTEPCPSCGHPIGSDADGRFPPWCSKCGTDFKRPAPVPAPTVVRAGAASELAVRHTVSEPHYYHNVPGVPPPRPGIDGPSMVTAKVWARCWKQHTCVECGCVYRYKFEREAGGQNKFEEFARQKAEAKLFRRLERDVDPNPCPSCGLIQPDMVGQGKRCGHVLATAAGGLLLAALVAGSYFTDWLLIEDAARYAAAAAGGVAVAHLVIALSDPNRNRENNLQRAALAVAAEHVEVISRGTVTDSLPPSGNLTARHLLALACVVLAAPAFLLPVFVRTANGWALQRDYPPGVLSPGDDLRVTLPAPPDTKSAGGRWRGEAIAEVLNAAAIGGPATLQATTRTDGWGHAIEIDRSNLPLRTLWAGVKIPDDPALAGQTLEIQLTLLAVYPVDKGLQAQIGEDKDCDPKSTFENRTVALTRDVTLSLADAGGSRRYRDSWAIGAVIGLFASLAGGGVLTALAGALRRRALPTEITPLRAS